MAVVIDYYWLLFFLLFLSLIYILGIETFNPAYLVLRYCHMLTTPRFLAGFASSHICLKGVFDNRTYSYSLVIASHLECLFCFLQHWHGRRLCRRRPRYAYWLERPFRLAEIKVVRNQCVVRYGQSLEAKDHPYNAFANQHTPICLARRCYEFSPLAVHLTPTNFSLSCWLTRCTTHLVWREMVPMKGFGWSLTWRPRFGRARRN